MFTTDNSDFDASARDVLNAALNELLTGFEGEQRTELEKSFSDRLTNAWHDGITVDELVSAADLK